jgi:hypothetical protein
MINMDYWVEHYDEHLKRLYDVFQIACDENGENWGSEIDLDTFIDYVYNNSSGYITPWQ